MTIPELVKTDDGSDTLFVRELGEHYHSTFGAVQESMHVFIEAGLRTCNKEVINLFEVGFGTGLNAYLTVIEALRTKQNIHYISIEKYPLPPEIWTTLNYPVIISDGKPELFRTLHEAPWNKAINITENFTLIKLSSDLENVDYSALPNFDLIYFDAFSPEKQPELWQTSIFQRLADHSAPMGKIVTYCAKGVVRRSLKEAGFTPERIPGPPGKREMLRGTMTI